ncbi:DUF4214 domain-containing protein [Iamia sp. SCSIO 61187]|uniref:DUF4214 domain-containing protein n=1 Tax=Iamia sp. SCSIO 61187 TaxID=2722752 RepID=UPI001C632C65|nr:DUF4214 domain-containing protein [Iamia sp. SCSIO 61187]QYG93659.1 DUF4214 domain-containing protein [Iamia sp. SCSIO 61187]
MDGGNVVERTDGCLETSVVADRAFVAAAHADLLGRPPTGDESTREVARLPRGGTRAQLLARLTTSDEWLGAIVTDLYADTLGREPDAEGLAFWVGALRSGLHRRSGGTDEAWVGELYALVLGRAATGGDVAFWVGQTVARGRSWVAARIHGSLESRQDRVAGLYQHLLGRAPEAEGLAFWAGRVARDGDLALARSLARSGEYAARAVARFPDAG